MDSLAAAAVEWLDAIARFSRVRKKTFPCDTAALRFRDVMATLPILRTGNPSTRICYELRLLPHLGTKLIAYYWI